MKILIEVLIVFAFAIAIWHEQEIIEFEDRLFYNLKRAFKRVNRKVQGHYIETLRRTLH